MDRIDYNMEQVVENVEKGVKNLVKVKNIYDFNTGRRTSKINKEYCLHIIFDCCYYYTGDIRC